MSAEKTQGISFRSVAPEDEDFLFEVYASTRAQEMAMVPWNEDQKKSFLQMQFAAQQRHYGEKYPKGEHRIILREGVPVGRIYDAELEDSIMILDITILPQYRNQMTGTPIIQSTLDLAAERGKPVNIYVEVYNPSLSLFHRLGFTIVENDGFNCFLEWRAHA